MSLASAVVNGAAAAAWGRSSWQSSRFCSSASREPRLGRRLGARRRDEAPNIDELKPIDKGENSIVSLATATALGFIRSDEAAPRSTVNECPDDCR